MLGRQEQSTRAPEQALRLNGRAACGVCHEEYDRSDLAEYNVVMYVRSGSTHYGLSVDITSISESATTIHEKTTTGAVEISFREA
jgi:hypothetical protein